MRDILFRGKRLGNGEWVYGYLVYSHTDNTAGICSEENGFIDVGPSTICQCTELIDINGKRIFESDRVRVPMYPALSGKLILMEGTVEWKNGAFHVTWDDKDKGRHFVGYLQDVEVIGNIYDNPELKG